MSCVYIHFNGVTDRVRECLENLPMGAAVDVADEDAAAMLAVWRRPLIR